MATLARMDGDLSSQPRSVPPARRRKPSHDAGGGSPGRDRSLSMLIEGEIIPRLMLAHATDVPRDAIGSVAADDVAALAPLTLSVGADALLARVEEVMARGVPVDAILVDLLAPTARLLGEWWEDDRCTFVDVTMGLWRLQEVVHEIAGRAPAERLRTLGGRRALFSATPGDQHDFGTVVIDELFRHDGWMTERPTGADASELVRLVGGTWFDLVGLTVSCNSHLGPLTSLIAALRNVSRNPRLCVMVGGRVFGDDPALALRVGADATACDAKLAVTMAAEMIRTREGERLAV